jgi:hypothetical protein
MSRSIFALVAVALAAPLAGCTVSPEPETIVVAPGSRLTVTWTVHGSSDPGACVAEGADAIDIVVRTAGGAFVAETTAACEDSATSIDLEPGAYGADAVLLDSAGHAITTAVDLGRVTLHGDDELVVDADFPADSFY